MKKLNSYDPLALGIIATSILFSLYRLDRFPVFVDIFYHMSAAKAFGIAGGVVLHDFWEFAPAGRAHLYPPLLHLMMSFMAKILPMLTVGKIISFIMFPLAQLSVFFYTREVFDRKIAFYTILLVTIPFNFYRSQALTNATSLVLVLTPLIFWAVEKQKLMSSVILMTMALYTHLSMPHIVGAALLGYVLVRVEKRRYLLKMLAVSYLLYLPWMIHVLRSYGDIRSEMFGTILQSEIHLILMFFGLIGLIYCFLKRKKYYLPAVYFLSMIIVLYKYPMRFWSHIPLALAILGGISLSEIENTVIRNQRRYGLRVGVIMAAVLLVGFNLVDPVFSTTPQGNRLAAEDPVILRLAKGRISPSLATPEVIEISRIVEENTDQNDIFFITNPPVGCLLTSLTGRSQMQGMWREVEPDLKVPPSAAKIFIADTRFLEEAKRRNPNFLKNVEVLKRTDTYIVFLQKNKRAPARSTVPDFVFPSLFAYSLIAAGAVLIVWEYRYRR